MTVPSGMDFSLGIGSDNAFKCQLTSGASCMPAGAVTSVFGRTGAVVAGSGDYSVAQITGAAALASPAFTGSPTAPTPGMGDNSTKLATTAYVRSEMQMAGHAQLPGRRPPLSIATGRSLLRITISGLVCFADEHGGWPGCHDHIRRCRFGTERRMRKWGVIPSLSLRAPISLRRLLGVPT